MVYEFLRNDKLDARNLFDANKPPYRQNQFGAGAGGPIVHNKLFLFGDYEGLRVRQGQTLSALVPTAAQRSDDFSSQLDLTSPTGVNDCNGQPTYDGELFDTTRTQKSSSSPTGFWGVPFGYDSNGKPSNAIPASRQDALGMRLANLFPLPNVNGNGYNFLSNPSLVQDRNQGDVRVDQVFSDHDTAFYRFSMSSQPSNIPSPFGGLADGGGFFTGDEKNTGYGTRPATFRPIVPRLRIVPFPDCGFRETAFPPFAGGSQCCDIVLAGSGVANSIRAAMAFDAAI